MTRLARLSVLYAGLLFGAALLVGGAYYFYYRPMVPAPEKQAAIERFIKDPASPVEQVRKVALDSHDVVIVGFKALEAAVIAMVILCLAAGIGFVSLAVGLRNAKEESTGAL
jgi:hypothetical protein